VARFIIIFLWILGESTIILAQNPNAFVIRQSRDFYNRAFDYLQIVEDKTQKLTLTQVRTSDFQAQFRPLNTFGSLKPQSIYWAKWEVVNQTNRDSEWYLYFLQKFNVNLIDAYIVENEGKILPKKLGMYVPLYRLPSADERFKLHFWLPKDQKISIFLRIQTINNYPPRLDFRLEQAVYSLKQSRDYDYGQIFLQGGLWMLALYNLLLFASVRDRAYFCYVLYLITLIVFLMFQHNFFFTYGLGNYPQAAIFVNATAEEWAQIAYFLFLQTFFQTQIRHPRLHRFISWMIGFVGAKWLLNLLILGIWFDVFLSDLLLTVPTLLVLVGLVFVLFRLNQKTDSAGRLVLAGSAVLLLSALLAIILGILVINQVLLGLTFSDSSYIIEFGVLVELICFSLALGLRKQLIETEKQTAQATTIALQQQINEELELKVRNRTQELEESNTELEAQQAQFKHLNENLEKEITKRTKELKIAIENLVEQNQDLEEFSQIISHNIRAPIAHILGLTSIINKENPADLSNYKLLEYIEKSAQNLDMVIKDLDNILNIQNRVEKIRERINLEEILKKLARQLQPEMEAAHASLKVEIQPIEQFFSIQNYIENILYHLLDNALKYRAQERTLTIEIQAFTIDHNVCIVVKDNGVGIKTSPDNLHKIFGLYKRMHDHVEGKGLGLYMVKTQVEALQGKIEVETQWREGTTFRIFLPIN
jgi:signal transduction histidine kinase